MKKFIAIVSTVSALGFAVALANTNSSDNPSSGSSDMSSSSGSMSGDTSGNQSGTAGSDTSSTGSSSGASKSSDMGKESSRTSMKKHDKWSSAKSCTDENGVTYYKGKAGFASCVDKMRKSEKHEQMGGTTPSDSSGSVMEKNEHSSDTTVEHSNPSDTSGNPSDSSSSGSSNY